MKTTKAVFRIATFTFALTGRIWTSSLAPLLLLLLILPVLGAQGAVVFTSLYSFTGTNDGVGPNGLVQGSDGNFYGTTSEGGINNYGTVFKISPSGALTTLHLFTGTNDGGQPIAALVQGSDGNFYGTTSAGGTNNSGTVFRISPTGALTSLYSFTGTKDGGWPEAALVQGSNGNFYCTTRSGGTTNAGTVFKISPSGVLTTLYSFTGGDDGGWPYAGLVQGSDGSFYGTTSGFGANLNGTVFKISPNGALTTLYSFTGGNDGGSPYAGLVQGNDGNFYGMTEYGGTTHRDWVGHYDYGTVFKISTNGALTTLCAFGSVTNASGEALDGGWPQAGLVQGSDGYFYGTTGGGGMYGSGTVFRLTIVPQPQLTIIPSEPCVILTWPTNYTGFTLQFATNLGSSAVWTTNSSPPVVIGGQNVVINTISGRQQFFRLSQ